MQKRRTIKKKTCFLMGLVGAVCGATAGGMMSMGFGEASFVRMAAFVLYGAMLLFMALNERGPANSGRRTRLLLLFFALLLSVFDLPLLCPLLEAIVLPLFALLYRLPQLRPRFWALVGAEALYAMVRTVFIMPSLAGSAMQMVGVALMVVSVARFWLLHGLYSHAATQPEEIDAAAPRKSLAEQAPVNTTQNPERNPNA